MPRHVLELALSRVDANVGMEDGEKEEVVVFHRLAGLANTAEDDCARKTAVD